MEVLVFSFCPHVIQSLLGDVQILGVTQSAALGGTRSQQKKKSQGKWACSHCGDTRSGGLSSFIDALDEFPLFPASVFDSDPVSNGLQVWRNPRVVSSFNKVIETRLKFLDDPSEGVNEIPLEFPKQLRTLRRHESPQR